MFFSVGYGKDAEGKLAMNFGPLNMEGGHRRLNVAITRARRHVKLISSMLPDEIDPQSSTKGVMLLRRYMEFAQSRGDKSALGCDARHEDEERPAAGRHNIRCAHQDGTDAPQERGMLRLPGGHGRDGPGEEPEAYTGDRSDGLNYASGKTARDRERLRGEVLQGLGWNMHRIWSRDWVEDRHRELRKIEALVERYRSR